MIILLFGLNIIFCSAIILTIKEKIGICELLSLAFGITILTYATLSGAAFMFNMFSFVGILSFQLLISIVCIVFRRKRLRNIEPSFQELVPLVIILCTIPFTFNKAELYATGQDQGLYQAEAIELIQGNYEVQHDFEEYHFLESEDDKKIYRDMIYQGIPGFYAIRSLQRYPTVDENSVLSDVSGYYHGVQTYPAILGLWGKIMGMERMLGVHTLMLVCVIILLYFAMDHLKIKMLSKIIGTSLMAFSPLTLWLNKTSYVEMTLLLIVSLYLYLITENENGNYKWYLGIVLSYFAFLHVSFLTIFPVFFLCHLVLYSSSQNRQYIYANIIMNIGLGVGNCMMAVISPPYYYGNCSRLFFGYIITADNWLQWIIVGCIFATVLTLAYPKFDLWIKTKIRFETVKTIVTGIVRISIIVSLVLTTGYAVKMGFFMKPEDAPDRISLYQYYGQGVTSFTHLTIWAFCIITGFFAVPWSLFHMLKYPKSYWKDCRLLIMQLLFVYTVCFTFAFFRIEIQYYYYFSRYIIFYVPIILVVFAWIIQCLRHKKQVLIFVLSMILMMPFDLSLIKNRDNTITEWESLLDMKVAIPEHSAVILMEDAMPGYFGPQFRAITNTSIFPRFGDLLAELDYLEKKYDNIFLLTWNELDSRAENLMDKIKPIYIDRYEMSQSDSNTLLGGGLLPTKYNKSKMTIYLYKYLQ